MSKKFKHMETEMIHEGYDSKEMLGSLTPPIFQTSTFTFDTAEQGAARFAGEEEGHVYSRISNPTVQVLEQKLAALEKAEKGLAFASGMAAISAVLIALTKANDHIICSSGLYGCTFGLLSMMDEKYNIQTDYVDMSDVKNIEAKIRPETKVFYIETPINPTMEVIDLELVIHIARKHNVLVVVDNTFSTPYLQRPIELGADVVVHSATKYLGGHGDVIAGLAAGKKELMEQIAATTQKDIGGVLSPFDAWLVIRGLKTLPLRMDRHSDNALQIAEKLKQHPKVKRVFYPGDPDAAGYSVMKKQMKSGGGTLSFEIDGGKEEAQGFLNNLQFISIAVSLGDTETLIQHPATMTHAVIPEERRQEMGITDALIRLSVGIEAWQDIWEDLEQALNC
ncbi:methionine gamma-lyase [Oceanobacillus neutriphilus]|uniref:L-methionine gamma-lyase n=1 Tax=Oceanobacillus neutriphilus TaxID=531815 RepID=A0ABQ2NTQ3_9BACI|nr:methionine gamma-lyase [Oceanobacillus neutriphilus]GGP09715.1 methionine gamma-lyase [Oceanobacillus neutriphilus]